MPLETRKVNTEGGVTEMLWGLIHFRGPAFLSDMKRRPYQHYSFFDLLYSEEQLLAGQKPDIDPAVFKDKIVFVGVTAAGLFDVFETPFAGGVMPGIQIHASVADDFLSNRFMRPESRRRAHRARRRAGARRRSGRDDPAGMVGGRRVRRDRRSLRVRRDAAVRRRQLDQHHAADARVVAGACSAASAISISSKGARSGR